MERIALKSRNMPVRLVGDIVFFKGNWFILGAKDARHGLYVSRDLYVWERVQVRLDNYARLKQAGGRLFCYRHPYCGEQSAFCNMMCSEDGFDWQPVPFDLENGGPHYVQDILFEDNQWVFLGESQKQYDSFKYGCFFSTQDLKTWEKCNTSTEFPDYNSLTLACGKNTLVSTARNRDSEHVLLYFSNNSRWNEIAAPDGLYDNLYYFQGKFFAFSADLSSCWHSSNALVWNFHEANNALGHDSLKTTWPVTIQENLVVRASLSSCNVYFSNDFLNWRVKMLPFKMHTCAAHGTQIVFVSNKGEFLEEDISFLI